MANVQTSAMSLLVISFGTSKKLYQVSRILTWMLQKVEVGFSPNLCTLATFVNYNSPLLVEPNQLLLCVITFFF
jgi:hypothetical protein